MSLTSMCLKLSKGSHKIKGPSKFSVIQLLVLSLSLSPPFSTPLSHGPTKLLSCHFFSYHRSLLWLLSLLGCPSPTQFLLCPFILFMSLPTQQIVPLLPLLYPAHSALFYSYHRSLLYHLFTCLFIVYLLH